MKKPVAALAIITILIALPIAAAKKKAYVDYDRSFDFSTIKTFAYIDTLETSVADDAPPVHEMIKLLVIKGFQQGGMKHVGEDEDPDIMVTYHTDPQQEMKMNVTLYSYSYSAGWYWSPLWGSGMDVSSYTRGTLIIDAWVPETNTLIWRGTVIGVVPDDPSPKKARKIIEEALQKIGKEWRKQKKNAGS